jgi:predicted RNase H-like HicB family nuclease
MATRSRRTARRRTEVFTAAYLPAEEGGYVVEILEAVGVHAQGNTLDQARKNLHQVVALMFDEAPDQFGSRKSVPLPGALLEKVFVVFPV